MTIPYFVLILCLCLCVVGIGVYVNSFECLPGFKGPAKGYSPRLGLKIQEDPKGIPSQHDEIL